MTYSECFNIVDELPSALEKVTKVFSIEFSDKVVRKIHSDSKNDQVNAKRYDLVSVSCKLRKDIIIVGIVDEYEPETIWLNISGLTKSELVRLTKGSEKK